MEQCRLQFTIPNEDAMRLLGNALVKLLKEKQSDSLDDIQSVLPNIDKDFKKYFLPPKPHLDANLMFMSRPNARQQKQQRLPFNVFIKDHQVHLAFNDSSWAGRFLSIMQEQYQETPTP